MTAAQWHLRPKTLDFLAVKTPGSAVLNCSVLPTKLANSRLYRAKIISRLHFTDIASRDDVVTRFGRYGNLFQSLALFL